MEIILVRHAHAEDKSFWQRDLHRNLSEQGRNAMQIVMVQVDGYMTHPQDYRLLVSPANRTIQTAEYFAQAYELSMEVEDFIYAQDTEAFSNFLDSLHSDEKLILVGHQPSLSEWAFSLSEQEIKFGKGDCVAFSRETEDKSFHILWRLSTHA